MSLLLSLAALGAVLLAVVLAGLPATRLLFPGGSVWTMERWGWSLPAGGAIVCASTAASIALGITPGWIPFLVLVSVVAAAGLFLAQPPAMEGRASQEEFRARALAWPLALLLAAGVVLYLLRALTEPMWSNDFLAIWGLKGKTIALGGALPARAWPPGSYPFAHPEYPLGLPLLYAGLASLRGRWDDHALALLFPLIQVGTLAVLLGWLRRRRAPWPAALAAAALLALFEPLYSAFLTGMADVPLSGAILLFGTALTDRLDEESPDSAGAGRRLALASLLAAATKNEGVFLAGAGVLVALASGRASRLRIAASALVPAAAVAALTRATSSNAPLRDLDFSLLGPRIGELPSRLSETLRAALIDVALPAWPALLALALLVVAGRGRAFADRLLGLAAALLLAYLLLPALAVAGPTWLVRTTLPRTAAALAPLVAAGAAGRFARDES